jgi:hypothetical protein
MAIVVAVREQDRRRRPVLSQPLERVGPAVETPGREERIDQDSRVGEKV